MILPGTGRGTIGRRANDGGGAQLRKPAVYAARKLRRAMSPPEALLWSAVRGGKLGFKVRRQHPLGPCVADFFVGEAKLVIEIDGSRHDYGDRPDADARRDQYMSDQGYKITRLQAIDVMRDLNSVLQFIVAQAASPHHHPADGPPPHTGEEK